MAHHRGVCSALMGGHQPSRGPLSAKGTEPFRSCTKRPARMSE